MKLGGIFVCCVFESVDSRTGYTVGVSCDEQQTDNSAGNEIGGSQIILRPKDKTAAETTRCLRYLKHIFGRDYNKIFKTITCDNGSEFADQQAFESVGSMFFYCHPSCPSERGSNENANILIRRKLPKGQTMKKVTQKRATHIQHWLNDYPRHIFDGKTAFEMFMQDLPALGLHNEKRVINFFDPHT